MTIVEALKLICNCPLYIFRNTLRLDLECRNVCVQMSLKLHRKSGKNVNCNQKMVKKAVEYPAECYVA